MLSIKQVELLQNNSSRIPISNYTSKNDFFLFFLSHLKELFEINEMFLDFDTHNTDNELDCSKVSTIMVDDVIFGDLYFLVNKYSSEITFFFHSKEFNHKFFFMENELMDEIIVKEYYFWLNTLVGFYKTYDDERKRKRAM